MEPLSLLIIASVGALGSFVMGAVAGTAFGGTVAQIPEPNISSDDDDTHETVNLCFEYTCHPEDLFRFLEKDMAVLNKDDRLKLSLTYSVFQGWGYLKHKDVKYKVIDGRASDMVLIIKSILLDDDSALITKSDYRKNRNAVGALRNKCGTNNNYYWTDSNSPLRFKITGTAKRPKPKAKLSVAPPAKDKDLLRAVEEVEDMLSKNKKIGAAKKQSQ